MEFTASSCRSPPSGWRVQQSIPSIVLWYKPGDTVFYTLFQRITRETIELKFDARDNLAVVNDVSLKHLLYFSWDSHPRFQPLCHRRHWWRPTHECVTWQQIFRQYDVGSAPQMAGEGRLECSGTPCGGYGPDKYKCQWHKDQWFFFLIVFNKTNELTMLIPIPIWISRIKHLQSNKTGTKLGNIDKSNPVDKWQFWDKLKGNNRRKTVGN